MMSLITTLFLADNMKIKGILEEDFSNYKKPSMFIIFPTCSFKCDIESGKRVCQNSALATAPNIEISAENIVNRYISNPITKAVVVGGLEPFDSWQDLLLLVTKFREKIDDDICIYTGYYKEEIADKKEILKQFKNIIIKFGRFVPDQPTHYDDVLGVKLASPNQYAERIS